MNPFEWHWLTRALLSLAFVIPAWLSIGFFEKTYQVRGEVTMIWYFLGTSLGTFALLRLFSLVPATDLIPPFMVLLAIMGIGIVFGSLTNAFLFSSLPDAPNPAIPQAIQGSSAVLVFILSALLAVIFPQYFKAASFNLQQLTGIVLTILGIVLVIIRR